MTFPSAIARAADDASWAYVMRPITDAVGTVTTVAGIAGIAYVLIVAVLLPIARDRFYGRQG